MITIENADKALKEYYLQAVTAQLNDNISPFFSAIEKTAENVTGKDVSIAVIRNSIDSVNACAEDADLPEPHKNRYLKISVPLKNIYGTIQISDKALRASRDSSGAFVNLVNAEMDGLVSGAKYNFQRMLYGDGTAKICTVSSVVAESDSKKFNVDDVSNLTKGMLVDLIRADGTKVERITITEISEKVITLSTAITGNVVNAVIAKAGAYKNELTGLAAIFGEGDLYGYDRAEEPYFKPYSATAESAGFTEESMTDVLDYMEQNFNSKINMILCSFATRKKIAAFVAARKLVANTIDAPTGFGVVTVNGIPVYADRFCPDNTVYFVNTDDFVLSQLCDWEWLEDEDGKILKQVPGKAAYSATLVKYAELICKKPCGQAVLTIS